MYTALTLLKSEQEKLLQAFGHAIPAGWERIAHHMTIDMSPAAEGPAAHLLGKEATLAITAIAQDEYVVAVKVTSSVPSTNRVKHITLAVNRAGGGKPFFANHLQHWVPVSAPFLLRGVVKEEG